MNVFELHQKIINDYESYIGSFINIADSEIERKVKDSLGKGKLWPPPLLQFNPAYSSAGSIDEIVEKDSLPQDFRHIFKDYSLYRHQFEAIKLGIAGTDFVVTSGTGSGKSLTYLGTIFNRLLANPDTEGIVAVIVYPMNALINSQSEELRKYRDNYQKNADAEFPVTFGQYTGQEKEKIRQPMRERPPQILLTNYMMLELLLTREQERSIRDSIFKSLRYLVFDELHTYRGRQGADIAMLIRRIRAQCLNEVCCIGTSATMVSEGSRDSQSKEVARVAKTIFGKEFHPKQIVGETLTESLDCSEGSLSKEALKSAVTATIDPEADEDDLRKNPVAVWLEKNIALEKKGGHLVRRKPMSFQDVARQLGEASGVSEKAAKKALEATLEWVSTVNQRIREDGSRNSILPYKLHQFIAQTGSVYTSLDRGKERFITLEPGIYRKDVDDTPIFSNVFSRATGHPFLCVSWIGNQLLPREFRTSGDDDVEATDGYLIVGEDVWDPETDLEHFPDSWLRIQKNGQRVPNKKYRYQFPIKLFFDKHGNCSENERKEYWGWFMCEPLLFDPTGGVFYDTKSNESTKLTRLGSEGRSTSTTITAFSILNHLPEQNSAGTTGYQKILSFTDNRQDAALQAGHFNDFVREVRLRSGIYQALKSASSGTLDYATLGEAIFDALSLPFLDYSTRDTEPEFGHIGKRYNEAFQKYLFFRALSDLRHSWRYVLPNLEECRLLDIRYRDLEEIASSDKFWADTEIVDSLSPRDRYRFLTNILDFFRREYALFDIDNLDSGRLKEHEKQIKELLKAPWTLDKGDKLVSPKVMRLERLHRSVYLANRSMGPTSAFGKFLKLEAKRLKIDTEFLHGDGYRVYILKLMRKLKNVDYLEEEEAKGLSGETVPVYRLRVRQILWTLGDGETVKLDPIKRRSYKDGKRSPNIFFRELYRRDFSKSKPLVAEDHTGQLKTEERQDREERFRAEWYLDDDKKILDDKKIRNQSISALFCSPTMELGVDIGSLSVVHMRNAPPNPANYVQRSGRAGRSGQGALVFTYCSRYSSHDRHYFERPSELVAGKVQAPCIDLCNKELLLTHLYAMAIGRTGLPGLAKQSGEQPSLMALIDKDDLDLGLSHGVKEGLRLASSTVDEIKLIFELVIADFGEELRQGDNPWYVDEWPEQMLRQLVDKLDETMNRWRAIYQSARTLLNEATMKLSAGLLKVESDDFRRCKRIQDQATRQLNLLRNERTGPSDLSEFYPYRYLAAEGFLPGYNFTRLPLRIFVPVGTSSGEFISRPRRIALKEYGPHNVLYYKGRKYRVSQLVGQDVESSRTEAKVSTKSGYFLVGNEKSTERCPFSGLDLSESTNSEYLHDLLEMSESRGEEIARITCGEEERISRGYELDSFFSVDGGNISSIRKAVVKLDDSELLNISFIPAARHVLVNRGWRSEKIEGFPIKMDSGIWSKSSKSKSESDLDAAEEIKLVKLWTSNVADALYIEPVSGLGLDSDGVVTLQYALKRAIESVFQVESAEIGVSAIGDPACPNIFLYEAAEGSLGILSQMVDVVEAFPSVVKMAKEICRFDEEQYKAPASYDDLMSYYNQRDHQRLDRFLIREALTRLGQATIEIRKSSLFSDYEQQYQYLLQNLDSKSSTELKFIEYLYENGLRLPDAAQKRVPGIYCQPDFYYEPRFWVFCDGTPHDHPEARARDQEQRQLIFARGDEAWTWHYSENLEAKISKRPDIFSKVR